MKMYSRASLVRLLTTVLILTVAFRFTAGADDRQSKRVGLSLSSEQTESLIDNIAILPQTNTTLRSGETLQFYATAYDSEGNLLPDVDFIWSLADSASLLGTLDGPAFTAAEVGVGRVRVSCGNASAESADIAVLHGDLSQLFLNILPDQIVNQTLKDTAEVMLFDTYGNLCIEYDLAANPLTLTPSVGQLVPDHFNDSSLQTGGIVYLLSAGVVYGESSAICQIVASTGGIVSQAVAISFNGYDILEVLDSNYDPIESISRDEPTTVYVVLRNGGSISPGAPVRVQAGLVAGDETDSGNFIGGCGGQTDTLALTLPAYTGIATVDTLAIYVEADFQLRGMTYTSVDTLAVPVMIEEATSLEIDEGSVTPDSIYPGESFQIGFYVEAESFGGPIDSAYLTVQLVSEKGGPSLVTLFDNAITEESFSGGLISYCGLSALVSSQAGLSAGTYCYHFDYRLFSGEQTLVLGNQYPDSVELLPTISLGYVISSLAPTTVRAGNEVSFGFQFNLSSTVGITIHPELSIVRIVGDGFSATTSLLSSIDSFHDGLNDVVSQPFFVPESQLGHDLHISAEIAYSVFSGDAALTYATDLGGEAVAVKQSARVQIIAVEVDAPNAPCVNTGQAFNVVCQLANLSNVEVGSLGLVLSSDGSSSFVSEVTVENLTALDTVEVVFEVTASEQATAAELFQVGVATGEVDVLPAIDNMTLIQIETPAMLAIEWEVLGLGGGIIGTGDEFSLIVEVVNQGQATTSNGEYLLTADGVDFGLGDSLRGVFVVGEHLNFALQAPAFDTAVLFTFEITSLPQDLNSQEPAQTANSSFEFAVRIESFDADIRVETELPDHQPVLPGRAAELFEITFVNPSGSSGSRIELQKIELQITDRADQPLDARDVFIAGSTWFVDSDDNRLAQATIGGNRVLFFFSGFVIEPGQTRSVRLLGTVKAGLESFRVKLDRDDVTMVLLDGPAAGTAPRLFSSEEGQYLISTDIVLKRASFGESLMAENNPFDPVEGPAVLTYELAQASTVELRVFTLTGEQVFLHIYPSGSEGGQEGENFVEWDGCNSSGDLVRNGVYVVLIRALATGETTKLRLALVR